MALARPVTTPPAGTAARRSPGETREVAPGVAPQRLLEPRVATAAGSYRRFVVAVLCSCLALLAGTLALNALVDPFSLLGTGLLPTAVESDRATKLDLIEQLRRSPGIVILGSSRARQAEPSYLERLTGRTGFNGAVTGGTAADAWVTARYVTDRFPHDRHAYLWFVDTGIATNGVDPQLEEDPRAKRYLEGKSLRFTLADVGTYLSVDATRSSWRVFRACVLATCTARIRYLADGAIAAPTIRYLPEQARSLAASVARLVSSVRASPGGGGEVDPRRYAYFERTLAFMNARGARPVIVLNPIHPKVLAALRANGFPGRKTALAYLRSLHRRYDFVVVDCQDISRFGGSARDFTNATHVNRRNMHRLLRYVVARSDGALG